jgi:MoaA/NifB/PqqE/SkfB family radical SAM enzyme
VANLVISNVCNAACEYCFAADYLAETRKATSPAFMSLDEYQQYLGFLERAGMHEARLLGGEPTLHPDFAEMVRMARERGLMITVFSHGVMPEADLQCLEALAPSECTVIVNMSARFAHAESAEQAGWKRVEGLKRLGTRAMLGVNIQSPGFDLEPVLRTIAEAGLRKVIRLGMALPGPGAGNRYVHPKQYRRIGSRIVQQAGLAAGAGVCLDFDCGFVRCMFSDEEMEALKQSGVQPEMHCSPILDICAGGEVLHCFSLSDRFKEPYRAQVNASALRRTFLARTQTYRKAGVFRECSACAYKQRNECSGGCLSAAIRRFQPANVKVSVPPA